MDTHTQPYYPPDPDRYFHGLPNAEKNFMRGDLFLENDMPTRIGPVFSPAFDLLETTGEYLVLADLPGLELDDLDIELTANSLTITGERDAEALDDGQACHALERKFGTFLRRFELPEGVDGARSLARLVNGVLTVAMPKRLQGLSDC